MKFSRLLPAFAAALCCLGTGVSRGEIVPIKGAEAHERVDALRKDEPLVVTVPPGTRLRLMLPAGWRPEVHQPVQTAAPTVKIMADEETNSPMAMLLTFVPDTKGKLATKEQVEGLARSINSEYLAGSVEKKLVLTEMVSSSGIGCYSIFTDANLVNKPTVPKYKYRYVASGIFSISGVVISFTVLTNNVTGDECQQALDIIAHMRVEK